MAEGAKRTIRVTQLVSGAGHRANQRGTLKGLGLDKLRKTRVLEDTPAVRGMIATVRHMVKVETDD